MEHDNPPNSEEKIEPSAAVQQLYADYKHLCDNTGLTPEQNVELLKMLKGSDGYIVDLEKVMELKEKQAEQPPMGMGGPGPGGKPGGGGQGSDKSSGGA